jgi:hypothetical protein
MTRCRECGVVDLGVNKIIRDEEEFQICPNCGVDDSVEEIDELDWEEDMLLAEADHDLEDFE